MLFCACIFFHPPFKEDGSPTSGGHASGRQKSHLLKGRSFDFGGQSFYLREVEWAATGTELLGCLTQFGRASKPTAVLCDPAAHPLKPICGTEPGPLLNVGWKTNLVNHGALTHTVVKHSDHDLRGNSRGGVCAAYSICAASAIIYKEGCSTCVYTCVCLGS
jgi:hypothetical protein